MILTFVLVRYFIYKRLLEYFNNNVMKSSLIINCHRISAKYVHICEQLVDVFKGIFQRKISWVESGVNQ